MLVIKRIKGIDMNESDAGFIDYDNKVQNALRGVVRDVLGLVAREGLQGEHHFYITFRTQAEGVVIPPRLRQRFPEEMTIVLQHKFWSLDVSEDLFSVGLSFDHKIETLMIPFTAIVGFVDPSEKFALQFQGDDDAIDDFDIEDEEDGINEAIFTVEHDLAQSDENDPMDKNNLFDNQKLSLPKNLGLAPEKGIDIPASIKKLPKLSPSKLKNATQPNVGQSGDIKFDPKTTDDDGPNPVDPDTDTPDPKNPDPKDKGGDNVVTLDAFRKK